MTAKFYDTNALLDLTEEVFKDEYFYVSSITLRELENIKTNRSKTEDTRHKARVLTHELDVHNDKVKCVTYDMVIQEHIFHLFGDVGFVNNDELICCCAKYVNDKLEPITFISNDISCKNIARNVFDLKVESLYDEPTDYTGFKEIVLPDEELAKNHLKDGVFDFDNSFGLLENEYGIFKDSKGDVCYTLRCENNKLVPIFTNNIKTMYFDKIKPKDVYQRCAIDALMNNTITALSGKAGSGKSMLSLMAAMHLIETYRYSRLVVMFNPTKTRGAADMGYYSGDMLEKALQSNIGQILTTKFGDVSIVEILLQQEKLKLVSMADARGMEIRDNEIMWITEAQNTSVDLIKLCLSRVSSGAKVIIEGDYTSQVDSNTFENGNNGLKRVINVFKGHEEFGYVQLQNVWRSKIAELCELL